MCGDMGHQRVWDGVDLTVDCDTCREVLRYVSSYSSLATEHIMIGRRSDHLPCSDLHSRSCRPHMERYNTANTCVGRPKPSR
jgi:hypothetical protein